MTAYVSLTSKFQFREVLYILSTSQFAEAKMKKIKWLCLSAPYAVKTHGVVEAGRRKVIILMPTVTLPPWKNYIRNTKLHESD